jgi:hypothetical protein
VRARGGKADGEAPTPTASKSANLSDPKCRVVARCRCQGRRPQRPQFEQVAPSKASAVDAGWRCNRRPHSATASEESCPRRRHGLASPTDMTHTGPLLDRSGARRRELSLSCNGRSKALAAPTSTPTSTQ